MSISSGSSWSDSASSSASSALTSPGESETKPLITGPIRVYKTLTHAGSADELDGNPGNGESLAGYKPGKATFLQTLLNMLGDLLGTGLLACPIAIAHLGWILGPLFLALACMLIMFTLKLLVRIIEHDRRLRNYTDIISCGVGPIGRRLINVLFFWEVGTIITGLIVLFSETLEVLLPWRSSDEWKLVALIIVMPATFLPLRYLAFSSGLGVLAICTLVGVLIYAGMTSDITPGSVFLPAPTDIFPRQGFPKAVIAFGLFMSSFAGHGLVPNLIHDMARPEHAFQAVHLAYGICTIIYLLVGCFGYTMYGREVSDALSDTIFTILRLHPHVPVHLHTLHDAAPPASSLSAHEHTSSPHHYTQTSWRRIEALKTLLRPFLRLLLLIVLTALSLFIPHFESIQGFTGCYFGALMLVVLPVMAGGRVLGWKEGGRVRWGWVAVAGGGYVFAIVGGVCAGIVGRGNGGLPV